MTSFIYALVKRNVHLPPRHVGYSTRNGDKIAQLPPPLPPPPSPSRKVCVSFCTYKLCQILQGEEIANLYMGKEIVQNKPDFVFEKVKVL